MNTSPHIVWHEAIIHKMNRQQAIGHKSCVLWLTGLSGAGKSTLANGIDRKLFEMHKRSYVLDGDNVRHGLNKGLGFSSEDRKENIRRVAEVAKLFVDAGIITITAFISPFHSDRDFARSIMETHEFIEIYVKCGIAECERRDPKGLYKLARDGLISEFTGITSPYEEPRQPEITIESDHQSVEAAVDVIIQYLYAKGIIRDETLSVDA
jgi:adenylylsulfate kinase